MDGNKNDVDGAKNNVDGKKNNIDGAKFVRKKAKTRSFLIKFISTEQCLRRTKQCL